jgi:hypothetical protein
MPQSNVLLQFNQFGQLMIVGYFDRGSLSESTPISVPL